MNEIKISIIVPVYQAEKFLPECLDSLISQNLEEYEILCIDDGSTDNSSKIIKQYQEKTSKLHYFYQKNQGVSAARNKGLELAKGNYILFVDADDKIKKNCLKYLYQKAERKHCDVLVFGGKTDLPFQAREWMRMTLYTRNKDYYKFTPDLLYTERGTQPAIWNKLFKRSCLKNIRFSENISIAEDMTFVFEFFPTINQISFIRKRIYLYRISNINSAMHQTKTSRLKHMTCHLEAADHIIRSWKSYGLLDQANDEFAIWLTQFLRGPYKALQEDELQQFLPKIEHLYGLIGSSTLLYLPESQGDSHFTVKRIFHILFRDIRKFGLWGGIENLIHKKLYR